MSNGVHSFIKITYNILFYIFFAKKQNRIDKFGTISLKINQKNSFKKQKSSSHLLITKPRIVASDAIKRRAFFVKSRKRNWLGNLN